jgi:hypothetical protein
VNITGAKVGDLLLCRNGHLVRVTRIDHPVGSRTAVFFERDDGGSMEIKGREHGDWAVWADTGMAYGAIKDEWDIVEAHYTECPY